MIGAALWLAVTCERPRAWLHDYGADAELHQKLMKKQASPVFKAMKRAALIKSTVEVVAVAILFVVLGEAASSFAAKMSAGRAATAGLFLVFSGLMSYVMWSLSKRDRSWTDHLKNVVSLDDFLKHDPAETVLAPEMDQDERSALLRNLRAIAAREDVRTIRIGLLPEEGYRSDRVLIETFAPRDVIGQWRKLLQTEFQTVSSLRYEVDGKRRTMRSLLFIWD
jgi:ABC-type multidrug transport system fused ATPase/permease subunit